MAAIYDYRTYQFNTGGAGNWQRVLGANSRRITIAVSASSGNNIVQFSDRNDGILTVPWGSMQTFASTPLTYRDYGTLIQGEIFMQSPAPAFNVNLVEIYFLRR